MYVLQPDQPNLLIINRLEACLEAWQACWNVKNTLPYNYHSSNDVAQIKAYFSSVTYVHRIKYAT